MASNPYEETPLVNFHAHAAALDGILETPLADTVTLLEWHATWERDGQVFHAHVYLEQPLGQQRTTELAMFRIGGMNSVQGRAITGSDAAAFFGLDAVPYADGFWQSGRRESERAGKNGKGPALIVPQGMPIFQKRSD